MLNTTGVEIMLSSDSSIDEEVLRNVKVIITTFEGTVPYDRGFGINPDVLDMPVNEAQSFYTIECITKIRKYEPRALVESIDFTSDLDGTLYPKVVISIEFE
ncbi:hypothetical protein [Psychrobacillus sp. FSL K6-1464]|uniref:hypothetical protein n=1 Tax=Psychrobacillus sp. FSL K6-1464 TaxID=2921545 RepID=UPI0030F81184